MFVKLRLVGKELVSDPAVLCPGVSWAPCDSPAAREPAVPLRPPGVHPAFLGLLAGFGLFASLLAALLGLIVHTVLLLLLRQVRVRGSLDCLS